MNLLQSKQNLEDMHIERDARHEALDMFHQWVSGELIIIAKPQRCIINVYTESRFDSNTYTEFRDGYYRKLKADYLEKYPDFKRKSILDYGTATRQGLQS